MLLVATFLLASFVTGRLDWLRHLADETKAEAKREPTPAPYGETGDAPTTSGGTGKTRKP
jgi:hypothetical protein